MLWRWWSCGQWGLWIRGMFIIEWVCTKGISWPVFSVISQHFDWYKLKGQSPPHFFFHKELKPLKDRRTNPFSLDFFWRGGGWKFYHNVKMVTDKIIYKSSIKTIKFRDLKLLGGHCVTKSVEDKEHMLSFICGSENCQTHRKRK